MRVNDAETWLRELGYAVELMSDGEGGYWADLRPLTNPKFLVPKYGRGSSKDEAIESAARRWQVEQIGADNARRPDEPLP